MLIIYKFAILPTIIHLVQLTHFCLKILIVSLFQSLSYIVDHLLLILFLKKPFHMEPKSLGNKTFSLLKLINSESYKKFLNTRCAVCNRSRSSSYYLLFYYRLFYQLWLLHRTLLSGVDLYSVTGNV